MQIYIVKTIYIAYNTIKWYNNVYVVIKMHTVNSIK
jgi:hypothetical protein